LVQPGEVFALELAIRAAGDWYLRTQGVDRWADARAGRLSLLRHIRLSLPNSGLSSTFPSTDSRHVGIALTCERASEVQECFDVNGTTTDINWTERLARNIRHARKHAALSQQALAEEIGAVRTQVVDWESGRRGSPGLTNLDKIAQVTGRTVAWFYDEHEEVEP
jgi:DNA-binding XRE family transcriptional regulator